MQIWDEKVLAEYNALLGSLVEQYGLKSTLAYLLAFIRNVISVDRILCSFSAPDGGSIEIASVHHDDQNPKSTILYTKKQFKIHKVSLPTSATTALLLLLTEGKEGTTMYMADAEYASILILPVGDMLPGSLNITLSFMSRQVDTFHQEMVPEFLAITMALRITIAQMFSVHPQIPLEQSKKSNSTLELLDMCPGLSATMRKVRQVAPEEAIVLIQGETGVGKEMVAEALHGLSMRHDKVFLRLNCGAIPENLTDSIFFGHEKGSFTGAIMDQKGYFEQAHGGTLFLDEIGELSLEAQVRLLRVLDKGEIQRVGSPRNISVNIRVLAATNRDLTQMVKEGTFRADLLYRLNTFPITIPPLRERRRDIPILTQYFLRKLCQKLKIDLLPGISRTELECLYFHDWFGNVRELEHSIEQALLLAKNGNTVAPLSFFLPQAQNTSQECQPIFLREPPLTLAELEKEYIELMLARTNNTINGASGAAHILGMHPSTLRSRMKQLGMSSHGIRGRHAHKEKKVSA